MERSQENRSSKLQRSRSSKCRGKKNGSKSCRGKKSRSTRPRIKNPKKKTQKGGNLFKLDPKRWITMVTDQWPKAIAAYKAGVEGQKPSVQY